MPRGVIQEPAHRHDPAPGVEVHVLGEIGVQVHLSLLGEEEHGGRGELLGHRPDLVAGAPVRGRADVPLEVDVAVTPVQERLGAAGHRHGNAGHQGILHVGPGGAVELIGQGRGGALPGRLGPDLRGGHLGVARDRPEELSLIHI